MNLQGQFEASDHLLPIEHGQVVRLYLKNDPFETCVHVSVQPHPDAHGVPMLVVAFELRALANRQLPHHGMPLQRLYYQLSLGAYTVSTFYNSANQQGRPVFQVVWVDPEAACVFIAPDKDVAVFDKPELPAGWVRRP